MIPITPFAMSSVWSRKGNQRRAHCKKDLHPMVDGNVYVDGRGARRCRRCKITSAVELKQRKRLGI